MPETPTNPHSATTARFEEVVEDILRQQEAGRTPDLEHYLRNFPDLRTRLEEFFAGQELFDRLAPDLGPIPDAPPREGRGAVPAVGVRLGGFELLEELGRGGMGVVYRARQLEPDRTVALKIVRADRLEMLSSEERRDWIEQRFAWKPALSPRLDQPGAYRWPLRVR